MTDQFDFLQLLLSFLVGVAWHDVQSNQNKKYAMSLESEEGIESLELKK